MQKYWPFEKTTKHLSTNITHSSGESLPPSPPSPADDPLDRLARVRAELKSATDETEETGRFDVSKAGVGARGVPRWAMGAVAVLVGVALVVLAVGWALK